MTRLISEPQQRQLLAFVRATLQNELANRELPPIPDWPVLRSKLSCFVTLTTRPDGSLRGCIGSLEGFEPLGENLRRNALNAAFADPRFPLLEPEELDETAIEISILSEPTPIAAPEDFRVGEHGVILSCGGHRAVFLPQVAPEQNWDRETTLNYLARKAGLPPDAWRRPDAKLAIFTAEVIKETAF